MSNMTRKKHLRRSNFADFVAGSRPRGTRAKPVQPRYAPELLEPRQLLTAYGTVAVGVSLGELFSSGSTVADGASELLSIDVSHSNDGPNFEEEYQDIRGTVTLQWYGGAQLGSFSLTPEADGRDSPSYYISQQAYLSPTTSVTLNESDAGPAIPTGSEAGYHLLETYYSGDTNFLPTAQPTAAQFQGGMNTDLSTFGYLVKFTGGSTQSKLAFIQNPSTTAAGDTIKPAVTVAVEDSSGNFNTSAGDVVTLTIASGTGTLNGAVSEPAVKGIAKFSNLSINSSGSYTLLAADSSNSSTTSATSSLFSITGSKLVFLPPVPTKGAAGNPLTPGLRVALENAKGKIDTSNSSTVVTLSPIGLTSANPITGNTATMVNGIATFSNVILSKPGTYQLQAFDGGDSNVPTKPFKVLGQQLVFSVQPTKASQGLPIGVVVEIKNPNGKPDVYATTDVELSLNILRGGVGANLLGTSLLAFNNGYANFATNGGPYIYPAGTYTLTATEVDLSSGVPVNADTTTPVTSRQFDFGDHLEITKQPTLGARISVNRSLHYSVAFKDNAGKLITNTSDKVQMTLMMYNSSTGQYAPAQFIAAADLVAGVASFDTISIATLGKYYFNVDLLDSTGAPSNLASEIATRSFQITPLHIRILLQPGTARGVNARKLKVNQPLPFRAELVDANGVVDIADSVDQIDIAIFKQINGVFATTPSATYTTHVSVGLADFPKFMISTPGIYGITVNEFDANGALVPTTMNVFADKFQIN